VLTASFAPDHEVMEALWRAMKHGIIIANKKRICSGKRYEFWRREWDSNPPENVNSRTYRARTAL